MLCQFCGKQLSEEARFCTGCGKMLREDGKQTVIESEKQEEKASRNESLNATGIKKDYLQFLEPVNALIEKRGGAEKLGGVWMPMLLIVITAIRLLGGFISALILTLCNAYLVYLTYKKQGKLNTKMLLWTIVIFVVGLTF